MASGTISLGTIGYMTAQIVWSSSSNGSTANSSNVTATLQVAKTHSYSTWGTWTGKLNIGGTEQDFSFYAEVNNSWVTVKSFSITKAHSDSGAGSCYIYGKITGPSGTTLEGKTLEGSQTVTLDTIPRYASITSFSTTAQTLSTATLKWSTNVNVKKVEYKIGSGSYVNVNQTGTGNTFKITGLSPSTTYKVKLRVTRNDSGLTTESSELSVTTLAIATITSASDFNIGNSPTINFTNPSGNPIAVYMEMDSSNTNISNGVYTVTGRTSYQFTNVNATAIYNSIPNANSKQFRYVIKTIEGTNNYYSTVTKTAYVVNSNPTIGSFTYEDSNTTVTAITEDASKIVRNQSNLLFTVGTATPKNSATISNYEITFNGVTKSRTTAGTIDFQTINLSNTATATLKVTDSRGNFSTSDLRVTIVDWVAPTGIITLQRKNNYEAETYLTVDGSYSYVNSKNSMTITYQYKKTTDSNYNSPTIINDNTRVTLSVDNTFAWDFKISVSDRFITTNYTTTLNIGMPILFIDALTQNIGINKFPTSSDGKLQVGGNTKVDGNATISGNANVSGNTSISGTASITGQITTSGTINSNKTTSTYLNGNKGINVVVNNTASKGFNMLARQKSTNGVFMQGTYNTDYHVYYTTDTIINNGTNSVTHDIVLLNESGQTKVKSLFVNGKSLLDLTHPVGSIYMSVNTTSPATLFGGTWERLPTGKFLYHSAGTGWSNGNGTGTATNSGGSHSHGSSGLYAGMGITWENQNMINQVTRGSFSGYGRQMGSLPGYGAGWYSNDAGSAVFGNTDSGGSHSHNIPYIAVFMWRRTA